MTSPRQQNGCSLKFCSRLLAGCFFLLVPLITVPGERRIRAIVLVGLPPGQQAASRQSLSGQDGQSLYTSRYNEGDLP